jgi:hypothetical protein
MQVYYYSAIIGDFLLRFGWAISLSLIEMGYIHGDLMVTLLAPLEVLRRFVWNFFRLENEHLNNCGQFRAVRDIGIKPMNDSDQSMMVKMMDEPDSILHTRHRKSAALKRNKQQFSGNRERFPLMGSMDPNDSDPYATVSSINSVKQWLMSIGNNVKQSAA